MAEDQRFISCHTFKDLGKVLEDPFKIMQVLTKILTYKNLTKILYLTYMISKDLD